MNKLQTLKILNNNNLAKNSIKMKTQNDKTHNKNLDTFQLTEKKNIFIQNYARKIVSYNLKDLFTK